MPRHGSTTRGIAAFFTDQLVVARTDWLLGELLRAGG
jgi:hypothetical protein